jgi:hypothetical protein
MRYFQDLVKSPSHHAGCAGIEVDFLSGQKKY